MKAFWIGLLAWLFQSLVAAGAYVCYTVMWDSARADDRWFFAFALVSVIVALVALMLLLTIVGRQLTIPSDELKDWRDSAETIASEVCPTDEKHCGCVLGLRKRLAQTTSILRLETCSCGTRPDPNDVPLDNVPGHHDFSCRFRELMQPVLAAADADAWEAQVDKIANGIAVLGEENAALRKRLEAAEEGNRRCDLVLGDLIEISGGTVRYEKDEPLAKEAHALWDELHAYRAALAGKG